MNRNIANKLIPLSRMTLDPNPPSSGLQSAGVPEVVSVETVDAAATYRPQGSRTGSQILPSALDFPSFTSPHSLPTKTQL